jgi:hypothetical protein
VLSTAVQGLNNPAMEKSLESLEEDEDGKQKVLEYVSVFAVVGVYFQFPCIFPIFLFSFERLFIYILG